VRLPRGLAPLRHRDFRLLASGQLASNVGDAVYAVALPWYVLTVHGGVLLLGTVLAAYGVARGVTLAVGGRTGDRFKPWTTMLVADVARTLAIAALAVIAALRPAGVAVLLPIAIVIGAGDGVFLPASFAIIPALVPDEDLQAGNALASGATQLATLVGPAVGGAAVGLIGTSPAFAIDGVTFMASILTLARIRAGRRVAAAGAAPDETATDGRTLWRLVRDEPVLQLVLWVTLAANFGSGGMAEVALPALAHGPLHAGAVGYGVLLAAFGGGALVGTLVAAQARSAARPAVAGSLAFLGDAVCVAALPYAGGTVAAAVLFALCGSLNGFGNVNTMTAFQRWAPPGTLGRLTSVLFLSSLGVFPMSVLLGGFVVHSAGPAIFFPLAAAPVFAAVAYALCSPAWREFGRVAVPAA
jgi:MFS family permease